MRQRAYFIPVRQGAQRKGGTCTGYPAPLGCSLFLNSASIDQKPLSLVGGLQSQGNVGVIESCVTLCARPGVCQGQDTVQKTQVFSQ